MTDEQKVVVAIGAAVIAVLLVLWFVWLAARAVRHRRPHGGAVTRASEIVRGLDAGSRPDAIELTEHIAWFARCEPTVDAFDGAVGRRGYLALTKTHLVFVPYHRAEPVVFDRGDLLDPASPHRKVWKKSRGAFSLRYAPPSTQAATVSFKAREPYTWMYHFGYRSGLRDDPFS
jgi:hypothetical protein